MSASATPSEPPRLLRAMLVPDGEQCDACPEERRGRSPRDWLADTVIFLASLLGGLGLLFSEEAATGYGDGLLVLDFFAGLALCCGLWWRRRHPVALGLFSVAVSAVSAMGGVAACFALFTIAVHRRWQTAALVAALQLGALTPYMLLHHDDETPAWVVYAFGLVVLVATVALGMFVRARRQLVASLRERAQRAEAEQELRVEQARHAERTRIAREMHDVLAHRISLLSLHAGALEFREDASPEEVAQAAGVIRASAHQALEDLRMVIGVLREEPGSEAPEPPQPTLAALPGLLEESRAAGMCIRADVRVEQPAAVPESLGRNALRIVQEGLTNARKHAPDATVDVIVGGAPGDGLTVEVRNRAAVLAGPGPQIPGAGTGLVGLVERATLAGGRLEHGMSPDGDFLLRALAAVAGVSDPIRVLVVDDDALVRAGLSFLLAGAEDVAIVGEAADGAAVPAAVDEHRPDVVLMDIRMPEVDGLAATEELRAREDPPEVIVLTTFDADEHVLRALRAGASGFLLKDTPPAEIVRAVQLVAAGEAMLSPTVTRRLIGHVADNAVGDRRGRARELLGRLSEREREVAVAIGQGKSNAEIGAELFMSVATVKAHVSRLLTKLDLNNRVQIALLAHDAGAE